MGANANPTGIHGGAHLSCGGGAAAAAAAATTQAMRHDPGIELVWSQDEQAILEEGISKYASDPILIRYAKIARDLPEKTVRDIALRCRWMTLLQKRETSKKRKEELRKSKDKKERVADHSAKPLAHLAGQPNAPPYTLPVLPMDDDDVSVKAIGGSTGKLLEQNVQILNQIHTNLSKMQLQDNVTLLCQTRDNILAVLKEISDVPEIMKQMPPLPVKLNEELANSILPRTSLS